MKVSTSKASSIFKDILAEKSRRLEMTWPGTANGPETDSAPAPVAIAEPTPEMAPQPVVEPVLVIAPASLPEIAPTTVVEEPVTAPAAVAMVEAAAPVACEEPVAAVAVAPIIEPAPPAPAPEPTPIVAEPVAIAKEPEIAMSQAAPEPVTEAPAAPTENSTENEVEPEITPAPRRPKAPKLQDLLGSDAWIRSLTRCLIDSEASASRGTNNGSAPIMELWNRLREDSQREKRAAKMEKLSQQCAKEKFTIPPQEVSDLKMRFLHAIRRIQEPYRSTLIYHYCEGLSVGEMVDRLGIASWIIRERLAKSLEQLDHILAEELGKEKTKRYVLLAHLGEN